MKKNVLSIIIAAMTLIMAATTSCQKSNPDIKNLCNIAQKINSGGEVKHENGMILTKCTFNEGDTVFTYFIKIDDNRFDKVSAEELKTTIAKDIKKENMKKITTLLKKNNFDLQYVYDTPKKLLTVFFDSSEL